MRYIGFFVPLFFMACVPEHSTDEQDAKISVSADANTDGGVIDPDGSINDAWIADAVQDEANGLDAETLPDASLNDVSAPDNSRPDAATAPDVTVFSDAGRPDAAETDAWVNPYCQPEGEAMGNLQIGSSNSQAPGRIILPYEQDVLVGVYRFIASGESFTICRMVFELCSTGQLGQDGECNAPAADQARYAAMTDEVKLVYLDENGQEREAFAPIQGNRVVFDGIELMVNKDFYAFPKLFINAGPVGDEVHSGDILRFNLVYTAGELMAVGRNTLGLFPLPTEKLYSGVEPMVFRKTKPTFIQTSETTLSGVASLNQILKFQAIAPSHGGVSLSGFLFAVQAMASTGWDECDRLGQGSKWELIDVNSMTPVISEAADWMFFNRDGHACNSSQRIGYAFVSLPEGTDNSVSIPANSGRELAVRVQMNDAQPGDYLRLEWLDEEQADDISLLNDDFDAVNWSDGLADDIDGRYLQTLPMSSTFTIE